MTDSAEITKALANLRVQAMIFDMEVDIETMSLVPKKPPVIEPFWIRRWRENREAADFNETMDVDQE